MSFLFFPFGINHKGVPLDRTWARITRIPARACTTFHQQSRSSVNHAGRPRQRGASVRRSARPSTKASLDERRVESFF